MRRGAAWNGNAGGPHAAARGVALVLVLWVIVLLSVIAGSYAYSVRTNTQLTANLVTQARLRALADAGIHRALHELSRPAGAPERWKADGASHVFELEGAEITVSARSEAARIDLNVANDELLRGLFLSVGVAQEEAVRLLDAVLDWRDRDEVVRAQGAERDQYELAGLNYGPANTAFASIDDLRLVLGMTPEVFRQVRGALTVYSSQAGIDSRVAPREVLLAVPGVTAADVDDYLTRRAEQLAEGLAVEPLAAAAAYAAGGEGPAYRLRASARSVDGVRFVRDAVVRLDPGSQPPFAVLDWREGGL